MGRGFGEVSSVLDGEGSRWYQAGLRIDGVSPFFILARSARYNVGKRVIRR